MPDGITVREIAGPLDASNMDDYLIGMARGADVDVIADATDFSTLSPVKPYPATSMAINSLKGDKKKYWAPFLSNVMGEFTFQFKLSLLRPSERTFLLWSEPDPAALFQAQLALTEASENARFAQAPEGAVFSGELSEDQLKNALFAYLKNEQGWTQDSIRADQKVNIRMPLPNLPPDLRALALREFRERFVKPEQTARLRDEFWQRKDWRVRIYSLNGTEGIGMQRFDADAKKPNPTDFVDLQELTALSKLDEAPPLLQPEIGATTPTIPLPTFDQKTMDTVYGDFSDDISIPLFEGDAALQKEVTLEAKRLPLREVLSQLQAQTGVVLNLAADAPAAKLVTARVSPMTLAQLLERLSRLYNLKWSKDGDSYTAHGNDRGELHFKLLQIGEPVRFRHEVSNRLDREAERAAIARSIIEQVGFETLRTPQGIAFSDLPQPLRDRWQHVAQVSFYEDLNARLLDFNRLLVKELEQGSLVFAFGTSPEEAADPKNLTSKTFGMESYRISIQDDGTSTMFWFYMLSKDNKLSAPIFLPESLIYNTKVLRQNAGKNFPKPSRRR